jgi:hypothetical protein
MIKDFVLAAVIIILNHWVYGVEDSYSYQYLVDFFSEYQTTFLAGGTIGAIALIVSSYMFENFGLYKISYACSKILVRVSQFFIMFLSLLNMAFYATLGANLMRNNGYFMLFVLYAILGASCMSLRIIDFNYHTKNALVPISALAALSVILVEFIWPVIM